MKYSEWKKLVLHLKGRWAEVEVEGIDGYFDCPRRSGLHFICSFGKIKSWRPL